MPLVVLLLVLINIGYCISRSAGDRRDKAVHLGR